MNTLVKDLLSTGKKYTKQELADLLHVSKGTITNYIKDGKIKAVKLSERKVIITEQAIIDFIENLENK